MVVVAVVVAVVVVVVGVWRYMVMLSGVEAGYMAVDGVCRNSVVPGVMLAWCLVVVVDVVVAGVDVVVGWCLIVVVAGVDVVVGAYLVVVVGMRSVVSDSKIVASSKSAGTGMTPA